MVSGDDFTSIEELPTSDVTVEIDDSVPKSIEKKRFTPLIQSKFGIPSELIYCNEGLTPLHHKNGEAAVCVKTNTASKLIEMGWGPLIESVHSVTDS